MNSVISFKESKKAPSPRGRPRSFDRDAAVRAALDVFWDKGFDGAQLGDIMGAMGINPPSFYAAFKSKEQLFREVVALYIKLAEAGREPAFVKAETAEAAMRVWLEASADRAISAPGARGCMLILGVTNNIPSNEPLRELLLRRRTDSRGRLRERLARGVEDGDLPAGTDVDRLSQFFYTTVQGISLQARDGATRDELQAIIDTALTTLPA